LQVAAVAEDVTQAAVVLVECLIIHLGRYQQIQPLL
jgi:hypothetical protein